jgi:hypothetical protein
VLLDHLRIHTSCHLKNIRREKGCREGGKATGIVLDLRHLLCNIIGPSFLSNIYIPFEEISGYRDHGQGLGIGVSFRTLNFLRQGVQGSVSVIRSGIVLQPQLTCL